MARATLRMRLRARVLRWLGAVEPPRPITIKTAFNVEPIDPDFMRGLLAEAVRGGALTRVLQRVGH